MDTHSKGTACRAPADGSKDHNSSKGTARQALADGSKDHNSSKGTACRAPADSSKDHNSSKGTACRAPADGSKDHNSSKGTACRAPAGSSKDRNSSKGTARRAPTLIVAHRGASGYELENTLAAFRRASAMGADGVELDVHATADGAIVVHHDVDVAGRLIRETTLLELREHRLANGEPIPTLSEALEVIDGTAYVEVKALDETADAELFRVFDEGMRGGGEVPHVHSFEHKLIRRLHNKRPDLTYGALSVAVPVSPEVAWRDAGATDVWQEHELISPDYVELAHSHGCKVFAWTVDDPERMRWLNELGVDGVCTNKPDVGKNCLK